MSRTRSPVGSLLEERETEAQQQAISNAREVLRLLSAGTADFGDRFDERVQPADDDGFNYAMPEDGRPVASNVSAPDAFPPELRSAVEDGTAGMQRFRFEGDVFLGVGIPLADVGAEYYEAFPIDDTEQTLRVLLLSLVIGSAVITLLAAAVGVWTSRRLLRPLDRISVAAGQIAAGDLDTRVAPECDPDLAPIVDSFNAMADAVQARVEREARFASDVSHELRTPITALAAATEVLEVRRDEMPARARQAVDVIISQIRRFDGMVLDLLELSRIDAGAADLHLETLDIAELCRRVAGHAGFAAIPIEVDPDAPAAARVDRVRFERVLGNLLANAEQHAGGAVRIAVEAAESGLRARRRRGRRSGSRRRRERADLRALHPRQRVTATVSGPVSASPSSPSMPPPSAGRRGSRTDLAAVHASSSACGQHARALAEVDE